MNLRNLFTGAAAHTQNLGYKAAVPDGTESRSIEFVICFVLCHSDRLAPITPSTISHNTPMAEG